MNDDVTEFRLDVSESELDDLRTRVAHPATSRRPSRAQASGVFRRSERIAAAWNVLMARLGYQRYGVHGSDWGTSVSVSVGQPDPQHVVGIHLTPPLAPPDPATRDDLTERERAALASLEHSADWDSGYSREHATRPQTIGYALVDSPAALCAWIIEKFWAWTDSDGHPENVLTRNELLDNLMLYWLPRTGELFVDEVRAFFRLVR